jgi:hypothetical protein
METGHRQSVCELTPELLTIATEVDRRRRQQSSPGALPDFGTTVVEVALSAMYGRAIEVGDLRVGRQLDVTPTDLDGNKVRVVARNWPMLVFARTLDVDAFVFAGMKSKTRVEFYGWLPLPLIEQLPVRWFERDGERVSYSHEVERDYLFPMPAEFRFTDDCKHLDEWPGWWEHDIGGWFCFGCQKHIVDADERRRIAGQNARFGLASPASEVAAGA